MLSTWPHFESEGFRNTEILTYKIQEIQGR